LPSTLATGSYRIKAYVTGTTTAYYGACFTVNALPQTIAITSPISGTFTAGQNATVTYASTNGTANVSLELVTCTGATALATIATGVTSTGSLVYALPSTLATGSYRIKAYVTGTTTAYYGTCFTVNALPQTIAISSPIGGTFTAGQNATVTYASTNGTANVNLELVTCTGTTALATIATGVTATGSLVYVLPSTLATGSYRIKAYVTGTTTFYYGTCFTVNVPQTIAITSPTSGTFTAGQDITLIYASTNGTANVTLELVTCTGTTALVAIADDVAASGTRTYSLPSSLAAGSYRIKAFVTGTSGTAYYGSCFSVLGCSDLIVTNLQVTALSPYIQYSYTIKNIGTVSANLSAAILQAYVSSDIIFGNTGDLGAGGTYLSGNLASNAVLNGTFSGGVVNTNTHPYLVIKVDNNNGIVECNESNNTYYTLIPIQTIAISSPISGTFTAGQDVTLTHASTNWTANVSLELVTCTGITALAVIADGGVASGTRTYTLPTTLAAGSYRIKSYVTGTTGQAYYGTCFTVNVPTCTGTIDELNTTSQGTPSGILYATVDGRQVADFRRARESRIQYPFGTKMPTQGTVEFDVKIEKGYAYNNAQLQDNLQEALLFTTDVWGGDVTWPGSCWLRVNNNGTITFTLATTKYGSSPAQIITATNTAFRFNSWQKIGISFGSEGQYLTLNGSIVASNINNKQILGSGGTHTAPVDIPTIGESVPGVWQNNQYDGGFEGYVDKVRISTVQKDWCLLTQTTSVTSPISGTFTAGQSVTVAYTSTNIAGNISVELVSCTGTIPLAVIADGVPATGSRSFTLPSNLAAGAYRIKVYPTGTIGQGVYGTCFNVTNAALPIELVNFNATNEGAKNKLTWTTANEINNKAFGIERSEEGKTFFNISQVEAANKPYTYQFFDNQPFPLTYYRLRQIDMDGTERLSNIVSVSMNGKDKLKVYPSPVFDILIVETEEKGDFKILNTLGQQVLSGKIAPTVDVTSLPQGTYVFVVGLKQVKFVKM
jgi:hypothetical protein